MSDRQHYSERLGRDFAPGDWLFAAEALAVLDANAGRRVSDRILWRLRERGLRSELLDNGKRVYLYEDLCQAVIGETVGRFRQESVNDNALRQRAYRERKKQQQEHGI